MPDDCKRMKPRLAYKNWVLSYPYHNIYIYIYMYLHILYQNLTMPENGVPFLLEI